MGWTLEEPGDEAVIAGIGDRAQEALAEAYRRHGGAVWGVVRRVCGTGAAAAVEDVCAGVFADLWDQPGRYDPARGSLRAWLVAEAHARAVAVTRAGSPAAASAPAGAPAQASRSSRSSRSSIDPVAVERLVAPERDALRLTYLDGRSCREAAQQLGIEEDEVKRLVRRGLGNLRRAFQAQEVAP